MLKIEVYDKIIYNSIKIIYNSMVESIYNSGIK